jgi:tetratricopeptide (TPR) repeat protein
MFPPRSLPFILIAVLVTGVYGAAQIGNKDIPDASTAARKAISQAESGHCDTALPGLEKAIRQASDQDLKRKAGLAGVHCAMTLGQTDTALKFLQFLARGFPGDPEVLYAEVHAYSDLSTDASQRLAKDAPSSPQAHELLAEAYEAQGKWDAAESEYRALAEQNPKLPGIHFRLGRLLLSKPNPSPTVAEEATREFQKELSIDPSNAGAEYVLGELARQNENWEDAVAHFSKAAKLDPQFGEAFLGLGVSLISLKRYADAIEPLQMAIKLEPRNPDAHYQLATAYFRAGRKQDGDREFALHKQLRGVQGGAIEDAHPASKTPDDRK